LRLSANRDTVPEVTDTAPAAESGALGDISQAPTEGLTTLAPSEVRLSQSSVSDAAQIIESMRINGWVGAPIDVVKMRDNALTTIDNTRVIAANQAGINAQAILHDFDEPLPGEFVDRFHSVRVRMTSRMRVPERS
jgi:hypothetical protein